MTTLAGCGDEPAVDPISHELVRNVAGDIACAQRAPLTALTAWIEGGSLEDIEAGIVPEDIVIQVLALNGIERALSGAALLLYEAGDDRGNDLVGRLSLNVLYLSGGLELRQEQKVRNALADIDSSSEAMEDHFSHGGPCL